MKKNRISNAVLEEEDSSLDFKQLWQLLVLNWYWFIVSILVCLFLAGLYVWLTPVSMTVSSKMEIIDKSKKGSALSAGLAVLNSLPFGLGGSFSGGGSLRIDTEIEILKSNTLVCDVVKDLELYTEYRLSKWGRKTLLYQNSPLTVTIDESHLQWLDQELPLTTHKILLTIIKDNQGYTVETTLKANKDDYDLPVQTFATLPAILKTEAGTLTLTENELSSKQAAVFENGYTLKVVITPPITKASAFINRLSVEPSSKNVMNMVNLSLTDENITRGIDFINHLVESYNEQANDAKNEEAQKTDEFVNARLAKIDAELGSSDAAWEKSKKNFQITTPEVNAQEVMEKKSAYETQLVSIGTELQLHDYLSEYVNNPANLFEIIPSAVSSAPASSSSRVSGISGTSASNSSATGTASLLTQHNTLVNQRNDLLKSMSEMSPQIQRVTQSIQELHPVIQTALKRDRQAIVMRQNTLQREYGKYMDRVSTAPQMERVLTDIGRQREIKQGVYLLMLQKREEIAMELANTTNKGRLIDEPMMNPGSTSPKRSMVLFVALFFGALLPAAIVYLFQMLKSSVGSRADLEAVSKKTVLGEVPLADSGEAIRMLRTNLLLNFRAGEKTIIVTSNAAGDGKTFIAQHLVDSLNIIGKKTLYFDCDFRKKSCSIPPADMIAGESFAQQVSKAKADYDYVVIDSPALADYSDAYQLAQFADATLFIVRAESTDKSVIKALDKDNNLSNVMLVLNALDTNSKKYKLNNKK